MCFLEMIAENCIVRVFRVALSRIIDLTMFVSFITVNIVIKNNNYFKSMRPIGMMFICLSLIEGIILRCQNETGHSSRPGEWWGFQERITLHGKYRFYRPLARYRK